MPESIGERIKRLRVEQGLSQRDISSPGCTYAYVSRVEAGARRPSVKALRKMAEKLGVSAYYLEHGYQQVVYVLVLSALDDPANVLAALHDEQEAHDLTNWFLEQGHNVSLQWEPVDDADAISALKQKYQRQPPGTP